MASWASWGFDISVRIAAFLRAFGRWLYGIYFWAVVALVVLPVIMGLAVTPGLLNRRRIARAGARTILALIGSPVRLHGAAIGHTDHCVVVANHASYLDGVILTAALPTHFTFLIKEEMSRFPVAGFVLRRLGSKFVKRDDASERLRVGRRLLEAARSGDALAVFPEGTFDARPGLKPFRGGAFRAAIKADILVFPTVIRGARHKFPAGARLPVPGRLAVEVCRPLHPRDFESPAELIEATRGAMLARLEEPDLAAAVTSLRSSALHPLPAAASEYSERGP